MTYKQRHKARMSKPSCIPQRFIWEDFQITNENRKTKSACHPFLTRRAAFCYRYKNKLSMVLFVMCYSHSGGHNRHPILLEIFIEQHNGRCQTFEIVLAEKWVSNFFLNYNSGRVQNFWVNLLIICLF